MQVKRGRAPGSAMMSLFLLGGSGGAAELEAGEVLAFGGAMVGGREVKVADEGDVIHGKGGKGEGGKT